MKFFTYDKKYGSVVLNDESILLIREFAKLMELPRNKSKEDKTGKKRLRAFKEFKFIFLYYDWSSPYFQFMEQDKLIEALLDAELTKEEQEDKDFKEACRKYDELQNSSKIGNLLKASYNTIDKITHYLNTLNLDERDPVSGKPIFKTKDVIAEMSSASKLIDSIKTLEVAFKKEVEGDVALRGNVEAGEFD
jgi:hypothetical protein